MEDGFSEQINQKKCQLALAL